MAGLIARCCLVCPVLTAQHCVWKLAFAIEQQNKVVLCVVAVKFFQNGVGSIQHYFRTSGWFDSQPGRVSKLLTPPHTPNAIQTYHGICARDI